MAKSGAKARTASAARRPESNRQPLTPERLARIGQGRLLSQPRIRALWPHLTPAQQQIVLDPVSSAVGHRFPFTSSEVAKITRLTERQVRYWADTGLVPHWKKGTRRLFEDVGLIVAFSLVNSNQSERQFYRRALTVPIDELTAQVGIISSVLTARLEGADEEETAAITSVLDTLPHG